MAYRVEPRFSLNAFTGFPETNYMVQKKVRARRVPSVHGAHLREVKDGYGWLDVQMFVTESEARDKAIEWGAE